MAPPAEPGFAALVRRLRDAAGLTQEELAVRAGVSVRGISDLERGVNRTAHNHTARMLAGALGLSGRDRADFLRAARGRSAPLPPASDRRPPSATPPGNLPLPPTPLVGRRPVVAAVLDLLGRDGVRLVTLTGVGGTGKTRLAIEVASLMRPAFADGVWFVDLAPLTEPAQVGSAIAQAFGVRERARTRIDEELLRVLAGRQSLLLLDNVEHLLGAAPLVTAVLARCPAVTLLVTSRTPLHVRGEHEYLVPPLELPNLDRVVPEQQPAEAFTLFVERARAVRSDFVLTAANARAIAEICVRLDGLPLAIELAAARVNVLAPQAILTRLGDRLGFLTRGPSDLAQHQRSLRHAIEWSYRLLEPRQQAVLNRAAVFAGGFTLEAAEAVCGFEGNDVLDLVASLVDQSLLRAETTADGDTRFRMLETLREYALERLVEGGDERAAREAHAGYYLDLAERAEPHLTGPEQSVWLDRLEDEHGNLRAALGWLDQHPEQERGLRLAAALWWFWEMHSHFAEGRDWLERALARAGPAVAPPLRAKLQFGAGVMAFRQRDLEPAERHQGAALALFRDLGDRQGAAWALAFLGLAAHVQGDLNRAATLHREALALCREAGDRLGVSGSLSNLGEVEVARGNLDDAEALYTEALALGRRLGNRLTVARTLDNLGALAHCRGGLQEAVAHYREALVLYRDLGDRRGIATCLHGLAAAAAAAGQGERAALLHAAAVALRAVLGAETGAHTCLDAECALTAAPAQSDETAITAARDAGRRISLDDAIAEALGDEWLPA